MKTREINKVTFELKKAKDIPYALSDMKYRGRTLADCYARPSIYKQSIYDAWREYVRQSNCFVWLTVGSYNCFKFTLYMLYIETETQEILGYAHITSEHNYLYLF